MTEFYCTVCKDSRHITDKDGRDIRCKCLEDEIFNRKLLEAGILFPQSDLGFDNIDFKYPNVVLDSKIVKFSKTVVDKFSNGLYPNKILCFQGQSTGAKDLIVQSILLGAVKGGLSVSQRSMEQLISNHFQGGEISLESEFTRCDILCLNLGSEIQYNVSGSFLQSLIRLHWLNPDHYLLLHTHLRWDDIAYKYGDDIASLFVKSNSDLADNDRRVVFTRVEE